MANSPDWLSARRELQLEMAKTWGMALQVKAAPWGVPEAECTALTGLTAAGDAEGADDRGNRAVGHGDAAAQAGVRRGYGKLRGPAYGYGVPDTLGEAFARESGVQPGGGGNCGGARAA